MEELIKAIHEGLRRKGLSEAAASRLAVGNPSAIKNLRVTRGTTRNHPIENLLKVAQVLDLEFYLGPRRNIPKPDPLFEIDGEAYAALPFYDVELSAGPGSQAPDEQVRERVAFRREWLRDHVDNPDLACLLKVRGDSMVPRLHDGDLVLVDRSRTEVRGGSIYALVDKTGDTRVKRLDRPDQAILLLHSDNPDYPTELRRGLDLAAVRIIGEVVWAGHTWR